MRKKLNIVMIVMIIMVQTLIAKSFDMSGMANISSTSSVTLSPKVYSQDFTIVDGVLIAYNGTDTDIIIPEGVKVIATSAFYNNDKIISLKTPSTLTTIEYAGFASCWNLKKVDLSSSINLTYIGNESFVELFELKEFRVPWSIPLLISYADELFRDTFTGGVKLYIPTGTIELYLKSQVWNDFDIVKDESTLPITLISFTAECNNYQVVLRWVTAMEDNNSFFTLERSFNGLNFEKISQIRGAGNSNKELHYEYTYNKPYDKSSYFRLSQTDYNGKTEFFPLIYAEECILEAQFDVELNIYPNPVQYTLEISNNEIIYSIDIFDSSEKLLLHQEVNEYSRNFDVSQLTPGTYFLRVFTGGQVHLRKFIKQ